MYPRIQAVLPVVYAAVAFAIVALGIWLVDRPMKPDATNSKPDVPAIGSAYCVTVPFYATPQRDDLQYVIAPDSMTDPRMVSSMIEQGEAFELQLGDRFTVAEVSIGADTITHVRIQTDHGSLWTLGVIVSNRLRCDPLDRREADDARLPALP